MSDFRQVTETFAVAPQIAVADLAEAARRGFALVINNRPDGEAPDQPPSAEMAEAAKAAGLAYKHIPVRGMASPDQVAEMAEAVSEAGGPVLAFCRSGTRSITIWSMGQAQTGARPRDELIELGAAAGYDLSGALGG
jgi:uncharacterized protein (TIGR01244 family)